MATTQSIIPTDAQKQIINLDEELREQQRARIYETSQRFLAELPLDMQAVLFHTGTVYVTGWYPSRPPVSWQSPPLTSQGLVYIAQLLQHSNTIKIGYTTGMPARMAALRHKYGPLRLLLTIPHDTPRLLEATFHIRFQAMRLMKGVYTTELFQFNSRRAQQRFERLWVEFPTCCLAAVTWDASRRQKRPRPNSTQLMLEEHKTDQYNNSTT